MTSTEIYYFTGQIGTAFDTRFTPFNGTLELLWVLVSYFMTISLCECQDFWIFLLIYFFCWVCFFFLFYNIDVIEIHLWSLFLTPFFSTLLQIYLFMCSLVYMRFLNCLNCYLSLLFCYVFFGWFEFRYRRPIHVARNRFHENF